MQDLTGDGFYFYEYQNTDSAKYYRCTEFRRGCPVRAIRRVRQDYVSQSGVHNHPPNPLLLQYLREREVVVNEARRLDVASFHDIFNGRRDNDGPLNALLNYHRLWPAMQRARRSVLPAVLNLTDLVQVLENPDYKCVVSTSMFSDSIYGASVQTSLGKHVVLFISTKCKELLMAADQIIVFTTQISEQCWVCSIAGQQERIVAQLGWMLLDDMSEISVTSAFTLLRSVLHTHRFNSVLCGDENIARIITAIFGVTVLPSFFDYINDLKHFLRTATSISTEIISQSRKLRLVLNECCSLPLLPSDLLPVGVNIILSESGEFTSFIHSGLQQLFTHINNNWLLHPLRRNNFMVTSDRTNFRLLELKLKAERKFRNNSDFYNLIDFFVHQTEKTHKLIDNILQNRNVTEGPIPFLDIDSVKVLREDLSSPLLTRTLAVKNFLTVTAEMLQNVNF